MSSQSTVEIEHGEPSATPIDVDRFYGSELTSVIEQVGPAMGNVIGRYGLVGLRMLSVGAGNGHEEWWLLKNGCRVDLLDLLADSNGKGQGGEIKDRIARARTEA
jgi:hypothetical protein